LGDFVAQPCQSDPYEEQYVVVGKSTLNGAGEGLFAKTDLPANFLACYYNGLLVEHEIVDKRSWRFNGNTISLDDHFCLDVPLAYASTRKLSLFIVGFGLRALISDQKVLCNAWTQGNDSFFEKQRVEFVCKGEFKAR
jgi:hypothetical protein